MNVGLVQWPLVLHTSFIGELFISLYARKVVYNLHCSGTSCLVVSTQLNKCLWIQVEDASQCSSGFSGWTDDVAWLQQGPQAIATNCVSFGGWGGGCQGRRSDGRLPSARQRVLWAPKGPQSESQSVKGKPSPGTAGEPQAEPSAGLITELDPTVEMAARDCKAENKEQGRSRSPWKTFKVPRSRPSSRELGSLF